jgi:O-antigen/teichoic acid export membrane protein
VSGRPGAAGAAGALLRDGAFSLVATALRLAGSLALFLVMARAWGPVRFGAFMYPYAVATILARVVDYGFAVQVARDIGRTAHDAAAVLGRALGAKLLLIAPTVALAGLAGATLREPEARAVLACLVWDAAAGSFALLLAVPLRAAGRFDDEAATTAWANLMLVGGVGGVLWLGGGPVTAALAFALARTAHLALAWRACRRVLGAAPRPRLRGVALPTLAAGLPFAVHAAVGTLNVNVDTLVVQHSLGAASVGVYQAGMRLLLGALVVADALNYVYLTRLAAAYRAPAEFDRMATRMTRHLVALGVAVYAALLAGGGPAAALAFRGYPGLDALLPLFGFLAFVRYAGVSYGTALTLGDRQGLRVVATAAVLALGLALNVVVVPRFGLVGAVVVAVLTHVVLYGVYAAAIWHDRRTLLLDRATAALVAAAGLAAITAGLAPPTVRVALGVALAGLALVLGPTLEERAAAGRTLARVAGSLGRRPRPAEAA